MTSVSGIRFGEFIFKSQDRQRLQTVLPLVQQQVGQAVDSVVAAKKKNIEKLHRLGFDVELRLAEHRPTSYYPQGWLEPIINCHKRGSNPLVSASYLDQRRVNILPTGNTQDEYVRRLAGDLSDVIENSCRVRNLVS